MDIFIAFLFHFFAGFRPVYCSQSKLQPLYHNIDNYYYYTFSNFIFIHFLFFILSLIWFTTLQYYCFLLLLLTILIWLQWGFFLYIVLTHFLLFCFFSTHCSSFPLSPFSLTPAVLFQRSQWDWRDPGWAIIIPTASLTPFRAKLWPHNDCTCWLSSHLRWRIYIHKSMSAPAFYY